MEKYYQQKSNNFVSWFEKNYINSFWYWVTSLKIEKIMNCVCQNKSRKVVLTAATLKIWNNINNLNLYLHKQVSFFNLNKLQIHHCWQIWNFFLSSSSEISNGHFFQTLQVNDKNLWNWIEIIVPNPIWSTFWGMVYSMILQCTMIWNKGTHLKF